MDQKDVEKVLREHKATSARRDYLRAEAERLQEAIRIEELPLNHVMRAQSYEYHPRTNVKGSPVETLALCDEFNSAVVNGWKKELHQMNAELRELEHACRIVEVWLSALNDREKTVITEHIINGRSMREMAVFSHKYFTYPLSADSVRATKRAALKKICEIAR